MCDTNARRIIPLPWSELPPSTEPLTAIRYGDVMHEALQECWGLAAVCASTATHPDGLEGLPQALAVLEQYCAGVLALYEHWHDTPHQGGCA